MTKAKLPKKPLTEVVFILDRSGSMSGMTSDVVGGFNSMLKKQKEANARVYVSTVLFNNRAVVLHDRKKIADVPLMTEKDYEPARTTALLDAVGSSIKHIATVHKYARPEDRPAHTLFIITTDGFENDSRAYNFATVKKMVEEQKEKYDWEFIFLGADIDAIHVARQIGIDSDFAVKHKCDKTGIRLSYETMSDVVRARCCSDAKIPKNWKCALEEDYQKRKGK